MVEKLKSGETNRRNKSPGQMSMLEKAPKIFGGSLIKGNPRGQRPLSTKDPVHLVLKTRRGFGRSSMLHPAHAKAVGQCVRKHARLNGVRIYHFVNAGNHIHLVVRVLNRGLFKIFIRSITGVIARKVTGRERGKAGAIRKKKDSFWVSRPFTRIASWGQDYQNLGKYMAKNQAQVERFGIQAARRLGLRVDGFDRVPMMNIDLFRNTA